MKCIKDRCYSPVACGGFGYCRELNFESEAVRFARNYLALNAAESGADELIRQLIDENERLRAIAPPHTSAE